MLRQYQFSKTLDSITPVIVIAEGNVFRHQVQDQFKTFLYQKQKKQSIFGLCPCLNLK
jgi:hypothetical protein